MNDVIDPTAYRVAYVPGIPHTSPPKDGLYVAAHLTGPNRDEVQYILWDASWGNGRGGWFDSKNRAVADVRIMLWYHRVKISPTHAEVTRLNLELEQKSRLES